MSPTGERSHEIVRFVRRPDADGQTWIVALIDFHPAPPDVPHGSTIGMLRLDVAERDDDAFREWCGLMAGTAAKMLMRAESLTKPQR